MTQKRNILIILLILATLIAGVVIYANTKTSITDSVNLKTYTSQDLKISFRYPKDWYVEDEYPSILISNFKSSLHKNSQLNDDNIEILIKEFSNCFPTLEEDLIDPACGQGKIKNKIVSKEVRETSGGEFLKYTLDSYDENQHIQYFFRKGEKILDIERQPDPSQFEKEFELIVNSIEFQ